MCFMYFLVRVSSSSPPPPPLLTFLKYGSRTDMSKLIMCRVLISFSYFLVLFFVCLLVFFFFLDFFFYKNVLIILIYVFCLSSFSCFLFRKKTTKKSFAYASHKTTSRKQPAFQFYKQNDSFFLV